MPKTLQAPVKSGPNFAVGSPQVPFFLSANIEIHDNNKLVMYDDNNRFEFDKVSLLNELNANIQNDKNDKTHINLWKNTAENGVFWYLIEKRNKDGDTPDWQRELRQNRQYTEFFYQQQHGFTMDDRFVLPTRTNWQNTKTEDNGGKVHEANSLLSFLGEASLQQVTMNSDVQSDFYNLLLLRCLFQACLFMESAFLPDVDAILERGFICDIKHENLTVAHKEVIPEVFFDTKDQLCYWQAFLIDMTIVPSKLTYATEKYELMLGSETYDAPITSALQDWVGTPTTKDSMHTLAFWNLVKEQTRKESHLSRNRVDLSKYCVGHHCIANQEKVNLLKLLHNFEHTIRLLYNTTSKKENGDFIDGSPEPHRRLLNAWNEHKERLQHMQKELNIYHYDATFLNILKTFHSFCKAVVMYFLLLVISLPSYTKGPHQSMMTDNLPVYLLKHNRDACKLDPAYEAFKTEFRDLDSKILERNGKIEGRLNPRRYGWGCVDDVNNAYEAWWQSECQKLIATGKEYLKTCLKQVEVALRANASQPLFPRQLSFPPPADRDHASSSGSVTNSQFFDASSRSKIRVATLPDSKNPNKVLWSAWSADIHDGKEHLKSLLQGRATHSDVILRSADSETEIKQIIDLVGRL